MTLPKFIICMDGTFRLGMVNQHKHLLKPGDQCIGGGYYHFDFVSNRIILDRESYDFGRPKWHLVEVLVYENLEDYFEKNGDDDLWLLSTKAKYSYTEADLSAEHVTLMFGKETKGLPEWLREKYADRCLRLPMRQGARSLNLSNTAAILTYETLRQQNKLSGLYLETAGQN